MEKTPFNLKCYDPLENSISPVGDPVALMLCEPRLSVAERLYFLLGSGHKDITGTEIFQGDILKTVYPDSQEPTGKAEVYNEVVFKDGCLGWIGETTGEFYPFATDMPENPIIVGNIFQHKHLLENGKA